jgi:hypothetical protein
MSTNAISDLLTQLSDSDSDERQKGADTLGYRPQANQLS